VHKICFSGVYLVKPLFGLLVVQQQQHNPVVYGLARLQNSIVAFDFDPAVILCKGKTA
jgi:hypothetical protein